MSQESLAEACGVSRRTLVAWEKGEQSPNAEAMGQMAGQGIDVLFLVTGQHSVPIESTLSQEERALLDNYKHSDEEGRAAARRVLSSLAKSCKAA